MRDILFNFLLVGLLFLTGCSPEPQGLEQKAPARILSLSAAATHTLLALGVRPAAIDEYGLIVAGVDSPAVVGKGSLFSREKVVGLGIDCAVIWYYQHDAERELKRMGIRVEKVGPVRLEQYPDFLMQLGRLTGKEKEAAALSDAFRKELTMLSVSKDRTGRKIPKVMFELYTSGRYAGDESYIGDLVRAAGGMIPIRRTGLINAERVCQEAPEVLFYVEGSGDPVRLASQPGVSASSAVRSKRIYGVPRHLLTEGVSPLKTIQYIRERLER